MNFIVFTSLGLTIMIAYSWIKINQTTRKHPVRIPIPIYSKIRGHDRNQSID